MKERPVQTRIWSDSKFLKLNMTDRYFFLYLFTNAHIGLSGFYELDDQVMQLETGLSADGIAGSKERLEELGRCYFKDGWVYVVNASKYLRYVESPKNVIPLRKEIEDAPGWFKEYIKDKVSIHYPYGMHTSKDQRPETIDQQPTSKDQIPKTEDQMSPSLKEMYLENHYRKNEASK